MTPADELVYQAILAEFSALRSEIMARIKFRDQLMLIALASTGAVLSFAYSGTIVQEPHRRLALYLVAPVTSALAGLWISNNWGIYNIRYYIIDVLATQMNAILQDSDSRRKVLGWETSPHRYPRSLYLRLLEGFFFFISFFLPGVTSQLLILENGTSLIGNIDHLRFPIIYATNCILVIGTLVSITGSVFLRRRAVLAPLAAAVAPPTSLTPAANDAAREVRARW